MYKLRMMTKEWQDEQRNRRKWRKTHVIRRCIFALKFFGTPNWYKGVDKPNLWQWLYKWRIGWRTAWELAKIRYDGNGV